MKRFYLALILPVLLLMPFFSSKADESPWPMFRHDLKHTGRSPHTGPVSPTVKWTFQAVDGIASSPSIGHNGTIYVGIGGYHLSNGDSSLVAINPEDGSEKWRFHIGYDNAFTNGVFSSPAIGPEGTIYFGASDYHFYAIEDSVTYAKMRWKTQLGFFPVYSSPAIGRDGTVYIGNLDFTFNAVDPSDGSINWNYTTGWCVFSSPAIGDDNVIYVGSKDHNLYAFEDSVTYGIVRWAYPAGVFYDGHLFDSSPAIGEDGTVYIGADQYGAFGQTPVPIDSAFYAVNPDGSLKWQFETLDGVESSPAIGADGMVYVGSLDSCVYAIEDSGAAPVLKWRFKTGGPVDASPTIDAAGIVYIGSRDSVMYAINPDGSERWSFPTEGGIESSVTIDSDGTIYFGSFDGKLYALSTGAPDVGVESIDIPDAVGTGSTYFPTIIVRNFRSDTENIDVECIIEDSTSIVYIDTVSLAVIDGGASAVAVLSPWSASSVSGVEYQITAITMQGDDDNPVNDTLTTMTITDPSQEFLCGDVDDSGGVDIDDIVFLINFVFSGGIAPNPAESGDVDCSGGIDIDDIVYLIQFVFGGGPQPCADCP